MDNMNLKKRKREPEQPKKLPQLPTEITTSILTQVITPAYQQYKNELEVLLVNRAEETRLTYPSSGVAAHTRAKTAPQHFPRFVWELASVSKEFFFIVLRVLERLDIKIADHPNIKLVTPDMREVFTAHEHQCDGVQRYRYYSNVQQSTMLSFRLCTSCRKKDLKWERRLHENRGQHRYSDVQAALRQVKIPEVQLVGIIKHMRLGGRLAGLDGIFDQVVAELGPTTDAPVTETDADVKDVTVE